MSALAEENLARLQAEFDAVPAFRVPDDDPRRYALWKELHQRTGTLTEEEQRFFDSFSSAAYCRTMQQLEAEFDQALGQ